VQLQSWFPGQNLRCRCGRFPFGRTRGLRAGRRRGQTWGAVRSVDAQMNTAATISGDALLHHPRRPAFLTCTLACLHRRGVSRRQAGSSDRRRALHHSSGATHTRFACRKKPPPSLSSWWPPPQAKKSSQNDLSIFVTKRHLFSAVLGVFQILNLIFSQPVFCNKLKTNKFRHFGEMHP
jgi:hypothetical protein